VYDMSHTVAILLNSGSSSSGSGKCTKIIDPDLPKEAVEVSKQELQTKYSNWVAKSQMKKKRMHKEKAKKNLISVLVVVIKVWLLVHIKS
jgi:hypothetical protein